MAPGIMIKERQVSSSDPVYVIAEMSANHNRNYQKAEEIIRAAKDCGADAVKIQTYTPDTITIDCRNEYFSIKGNIWEGQNLYQLYQEAYTPWEWQPSLKHLANDLGLDFFSSPFDHTAVDFLEKMEVPAYKIASFELIDIPLIKRIAQTGKPVILSTGMASLGEIEEAITTLNQNGCRQIVLLKCTSAYPAPPETMNLRTLPHLAQAFHLPVGLSDHTLGSAVPVAAVSLGACVVEKHLCISRDEPGPDAAFSMEPQEFRQMVRDIRTVEKALGKVNYTATEKEKANRTLRRSLFAVADISKGERLTGKNIRSIRPGAGLHPRYLETVIGKKAIIRIQKGTPLDWKLFR